MRVLGIDSSARASGWALVEVVGRKEFVIGHGVVRGDDCDVLDDVASRMTLDGCLPDRAVIEDNYAGRGGKQNIHTLKLLAEVVGRWKQALEVRGIACTTIQPSSWQAGMLRGFCAGNAPREERKAASMRVAKACLRVDLPEDAADAALIALWAARQGGVA